MSISILVVDDSGIMRNMVKKALEMGGYTCTLAENGEDALENYERNKIDLIITDINMPIMDGITLIEAIRKKDKKIPIFALTSNSDEAMRNRGKEAGANGWVVKPFQPPQFLDLLKQVIEKFDLDADQDASNA